MKHLITEHHYAMYGGKSWSVNVGTTTNIRKTISKLADQRRAGDIPATLSHWMVGGKRVVGQSASKLFDRQNAERRDFFNSLGEAIDG